MCEPCRLLRKCKSCHDGCCPRTSCCQRSCSINTRNCRVVFPGEFQKFSEMVPPSFLLKSPKPPKPKKKHSKSSSSCGDKCQDPCVDTCTEQSEHPNQNAEKENGEEGAEEYGQDGVAGYGGYGPRLQEDPGAGFQGVTGPRFGFQPGQPTIIPCYGTYGPTGNPVIFGIPPPTQYGSFGVPRPFVLPVATSAGQGDARNLRAAGLPTQYSSEFNPCTGEVVQCGNQQMPAGRPRDTREIPSYDQFCQDIDTGFGPSNQYYSFNAAGQAVEPSPVDQRQFIQNNLSAEAPPVYTQNQEMPLGLNNQNFPPSQPPMERLCQGSTRSKSLSPRNEPRNYSTDNQLEFRGAQAYNQQNPNSDFRPTSKPIASAVPVSKLANRSKSVGQRHLPRDVPSDVMKSPAREMDPQTDYYSKNSGGRSVPKSMPSAGQGRQGDSMPPRNKSMVPPANRQPDSNIIYSQQYMGMGIDPNNQYFPYNDCAPLNATFVHDLGSPNDQNCQDMNGLQSERTRNVSHKEHEKSKSSKKGQSSSRSAKQKSQDNACSELLNRIAESYSPSDLQRWCDLLMSKARNKNQPTAKKNKKSKRSSKMNQENSIVQSDTNGRTSTAGTPASDTEVSEDANATNEGQNASPKTAPKPETRNCGCSANLPEENSNENLTSAPCGSGPACWTWYYNPCTGCYYYCGNCCNGCRNCCNHSCSPCSCCCNNSSAQMEAVPPKPKSKNREKPEKVITSKRNSAGAAVNCNMWGATMPGYNRTASPSPQYSSPYSGRWEAGGVDINRNHHNQRPFNFSCVRHN
ncbi:uncharacterized protein LOC108107970 [Drosophila eugracilis]|uniref:uncharacterized protein LOC108107970 n=1 Tax=Drosophila eugracilis TaxID=29029 RepID=UPI0007E73272|nr:uncharacterized protein LOC108107970 [Drosophila eugracilis]